MEHDRPSHQDVVDATAETEAEMRPQPVPVNMYEAGEALVILAPMPAVTPGDVQIEVEPGHLRFWAHLRSSGPREFILNEWEYGGYERELDIPAGYGGSVEASLSNGQLVIRVMKGETGGKLLVTPRTP